MWSINKKYLKWLLPVCGIVVLTSVTVSAFGIPGLNRHEKLLAAKGVLSIPSIKVSDGKAHFFRYPDNGKELRFFIVQGGDGKIRAAFDACDVCYKEKKGYVQKGNAMVCKNCGMKFAVDRLGPHAIGGCNPSYLRHRLAAGNIIISVTDLKSGSKFF